METFALRAISRISIRLGSWGLLLTQHLITMRAGQSWKTFSKRLHLSPALICRRQALSKVSVQEKAEFLAPLLPEWSGVEVLHGPFIGYTRDNFESSS